MKAEDAYLILEINIYVTRNGNSYVDERHLKTEDDFKYYGATKKEKRYVIRGVSGIKMNPACIYETALSDGFGYISGLFKVTRKYQRDFDKTYFKFYDDAEEVLENVKRFILWLKNPKKVMSKKEKRTMEKYFHLIRDAPDIHEWPQIQASPVGSNPKLRTSLSPLGKDLAETRDLLQGRV